MSIVTKEDERAVLSKIRAMISNLGSDSYLSMTFDGIWDIAENNIANDFGTSVRDIISSKDALMDSDNKLRQEVALRARESEKLTDKLESQLKDFYKLREERDNLIIENSGVSALRMEVTELKAKLYDMMVGGK